MKTAAAHYDSHLGRVYAWMLGDLKAAAARSAAELAEMSLPEHPGEALDLGAGIGLHAVALAQRGYAVTAIDGCQLLLDQLVERATGLAVKAVCGDLIRFRAEAPGPFDVILCLGDTLTHLPDVPAVERLLDGVAESLNAGGLFAATFRNYVTPELKGDERFILVRRDAERVLTCFLEYGEDRVTVHDLLTERQDRQWTQTVSSYPKLRLAPEWVAAQLEQRGLAARRETAPSGMVRIVGRRAEGAREASDATGRGPQRRNDL
jgi:2-polyprenyl-3-methyl-5-hydroxy-6-metoxy-1,4-benzoquinol methylase